MSKIQELMAELGAKAYKEGKSWRGYKVYLPVWEGNPVIGLPYVVLQSEQETRLCTPDEAMEYLEITS